jgi:alkanesulfonate monooxygenase SsuD/methylene tetrahydromethanopterin reductase-like flavin-dependent oxidoreductase (luciferase family)
VRFGGHYFPAYVASGGTVAQFYRDMFQQFALLEATGFDDVWVTEHHFDDFGGTLPDPATFLAAVAARTRRIRVGVAIVVMGLRNPVQVAESYAMVDVISEGRLEFGVGRGSTAAEFDSFGVDLQEAPERFQEGADLVVNAWTHDVLQHHGRFYNYAGMNVLPKPVQTPHPPVWVGASRSDDTFRWAGRHGFNLMVLPTSYDRPVLHQAIETYRDELRAAGHAPAQKHVLAKFHVYVGATAAAAERECAPYLETTLRMNDDRNPARVGRGVEYTLDAQRQKGYVIAGDAAHCIDQLRSWVEDLTVDTVSCTFHFGGMPQELALASIRRFAERVMPAFEHVKAQA